MRKAHFQAHFVKSGVLVKHMLETHKDFIMETMKSDCNHHPDPGDSTMRRHFDCKFCEQKFLKRHRKLFLLHLEQKHLPELEAFLISEDLIGNQT